MKEEVYIEYLNSGVFCDTILDMGENKISEEDFLLELINKSRFKSIHGNKDFYLIKKQSNKENDTTNGVYSCDFKLIVSSDFVKAESNFRNQVKVIGCGIITCASRKQGSEKVTNLAKAIRLSTLQDMIKISNGEAIHSKVTKSMRDYINNLKKNKNLFLFIPAIFSHKNSEMNEDEKQNETFGLIFEGFRNSKLFREHLKIENKDIWLVFIYNDKFVIMEIDSDQYNVVDMVNCTSVEQFIKKMDLLDWY